MPTNYSLKLLTPPVTEPVSEAEAMAHLRLEINEESLLLARLITAARMQAEAWTGRSLVTQSWRWSLDRWPVGRNGMLTIPKPPLQSVDQILLFDAQDQSALWDAQNYLVDTGGEPARLILRAGVLPPVPGRGAAGIAIDFSCGYGGAGGDIPAPVRQAILMLIAHYYENRELVAPAPGAVLLPQGPAALLAPYKVVRL